MTIKVNYLNVELSPPQQGWDLIKRRQKVHNSRSVLGIPIYDIKVERLPQLSGEIRGHLTWGWGYSWLNPLFRIRLSNRGPKNRPATLPLSPRQTHPLLSSRGERHLWQAEEQGNNSSQSLCLKKYKRHSLFKCTKNKHWTCALGSIYPVCKQG